MPRDRALGSGRGGQAPCSTCAGGWFRARWRGPLGWRQAGPDRTACYSFPTPVSARRCFDLLARVREPRASSWTWLLTRPTRSNAGQPSRCDACRGSWAASHVAEEASVSGETPGPDMADCTRRVRWLRCPEWLCLASSRVCFYRRHGSIRGMDPRYTSSCDRCFCRELCPPPRGSLRRGATKGVSCSGESDEGYRSTGIPQGMHQPAWSLPLFSGGGVGYDGSVLDLFGSLGTVLAGSLAGRLTRGGTSDGGRFSNIRGLDRSLGAAKHRRSLDLHWRGGVLHVLCSW